MSAPARFSISYASGAYKVSIPNYSGGEVVRAEVADALVRALEPFAELADEGNEDQPDDTKVTVHAGRSTCYGLTLADLRRARAALAQAEGSTAVHMGSVRSQLTENNNR